MSDDLLLSYAEVEDDLRFDDSFFRGLLNSIAGKDNKRVTAKSLVRWAEIVSPVLTVFKKDYLEDPAWYARLSFRIGATPADWITQIPSIAKICRLQQNGEDISSRDPISRKLATVAQEMCNIKNRPDGFFMSILQGKRLKKFCGMTKDALPANNKLEGGSTAQEQQVQGGQICGTKRTQEESSRYPTDQTSSSDHQAKRMRMELGAEDSPTVSELMKRVDQLENKINELSTENNQLKTNDGVLTEGFRQVAEFALKTNDLANNNSRFNQQNSEEVAALRFQVDANNNRMVRLEDADTKQVRRIKQLENRANKKDTQYKDQENAMAAMRGEIEKVKQKIAEAEARQISGARTSRR